MRKKIVLTVVAVALALALGQSAFAQDAMIGEIRMFGGNFAPRGWAFCEGQLLPISQYQSLFSILGTTYGGDGRTTFALPDFRGRVVIQPGTGPNLSTYRLGQKGGTEFVNLGVANLPPHDHAIPIQPGVADADTPAKTVLAKTDGVKIYSSQPSGEKNMTGQTGGGQAVTNIQPFAAVNFIICIQGLYPSRP